MSASSSDALPTRRAMQFQVLKTATQIKLRELNAHERKLHAHYTALLRQAGLVDAAADGAATSTDGAGASGLSEAASEARRRSLHTLYDGVKKLRVVQSALHPSLEDVGGLVNFAQCDPWSTQAAVDLRKEQLLREIRQRRSLWRHNKLLGALLREALVDTEQQQRTQNDDDSAWEPVGPSDGEPSADGREGPLAELTKEETQRRLEGYFFTSAVDSARAKTEDEVYAYLETQVFQRRPEYSEDVWQRLHKRLSETRNAMASVSKQFLEQRVSVDARDVAHCIKLLLRDRQAFNDGVVAFLLDTQRSEQTQQELAHVLTIELSNLQDFAWPAEGVPVNFQRGINGRFRCHLQEEAVTLLLFQFVGLRWAEAVTQHLSPLLDTLRDRRDNVVTDSVEGVRRALEEQYTLIALDANTAYDEDRADADKKQTPTTKQDLLRLLCAEARYQGVMQDPDASGPRPSITAVTTDLEFFGPSVSHEAILACLRFFGVSDAMRTVFRRYMRIPLAFPGCDAPKCMERGVSIGRWMSLFLAEVVLFVLDFSVRASTRGAVRLLRRHDDIIFYSDDEAAVVKAWATMQEWAAIAGLRFNMDKSGGVRLRWSPSSTSTPTSSTDAEPLPSELPSTPIRWGLLELQPDATVRLCEDKAHAFATEMADRLRHAPSVFRWISVYNKYVTFFLRNFGSVSPVHGFSHVELLLDALRDIHRRVFPVTGGDVVASLRERIAQQCDAEMADEVQRIPAAWLLWPLELGGLGLYNPFLSVWALKWALYSYLEGYHVRSAEPWPEEKAEWPWREPFTTVIKDILTMYRTFAERVQKEAASKRGREGDEDDDYEDDEEEKGKTGARKLPRNPLKPLFQSTSSDMWFLFTKSPEIDDLDRQSGRSKEKWDRSFELRSMQEFLDTMAHSGFMRRLGTEFEQCIRQVDATLAPPTHLMPSPSPALKDAISLIESQDAPTAVASYWKWVAFVYSSQVMEEFGTVSFFSRELLPAQLIDTIKKETVSW
ncbi:hypothetical protein P43SY_004768 [Pythium insidiosum]|uniref:Reverse transcriptase domain-containing protein n=1 Tax=Pythium insidiosum TaxID=114742 RepID=A0AAD5LQW9_PYTIN|nr:hypothetical protein P43SY_004768 [Pythium insidiosum]